MCLYFLAAQCLVFIGCYFRLACVSVHCPAFMRKAGLSYFNSEEMSAVSGSPGQGSDRSSSKELSMISRWGQSSHGGQ